MEKVEKVEFLNTIVITSICFIHMKNTISLLTQLIIIGTDAEKKRSSRALPSGKQITIHINYQQDMLLY